MTDRPSKKELYNKIRDARTAVAQGRIEIVEAASVAADAIDLDYDVETELSKLLLYILEELSPGHYQGSRPPQRSYETKIAGLDLFAFAVKTSYLKYAAYIKFALADDIFWLVSLHRGRLEKEDA